MSLNFKTKPTIKFFMILLAGISFSFSASTVIASDSHNHKKSDTKKSKRKELTKKNKMEFIAVLEANEKLHQSFFNYDGKKVESAAKSLKKSLDSLTDKKMAKIFSFSKTKLDMIKATADRKENNQNYYLVSLVLIQLLDTYDVGKEYNAYSCDMAKKKWIQNSKKMSKVHNPYVAGMPHCGSQDSHY